MAFAALWTGSSDGELAVRSSPDSRLPAIHVARTIPLAMKIGDDNQFLSSEILGAAHEFVRRVSARYALREAKLFGSRARGVHRPDSDVDVAVVLRGPRGPFLSTKLDMVDIAFDVLLETGIYIQPMPIWEEQWEHPETHSNPRLLENIERDGIAL
jgi:predicted nucleotidyltransferase